MTPAEAMELLLRVLNEIQAHTIDNPIRIKSLALEFDIDERKVKGCIRQLIDAGYKIGSNKSTKAPMGVFLATQPSKILETAERLRQEGLVMLRRASLLSHSWGDQPTLAESLASTSDEEFWHVRVTQELTEASQTIDDHQSREAAQVRSLQAIADDSATSNSQSGGLCPIST